MARNSKLLAAAATVVFLALGGGAFAMATNPGGNGPGPGPGPAGHGPSISNPSIDVCGIQADRKNLTGSERRGFVLRCQQGNT
jgi:hypothetical protein